MEQRQLQLERNNSEKAEKLKVANTKNQQFAQEKAHLNELLTAAQRVLGKDVDVHWERDRSQVQADDAEKFAQSLLLMAELPPGIASADWPALSVTQCAPDN